jgi:hypothetical protein
MKFGKKKLMLAIICLFSLLSNYLIKKYKNKTSIKANQSYLDKKLNWKTLFLAYKNLNDQFDYFNDQIKKLNKDKDKSADVLYKYIENFTNEFNNRSG